MTRAEMESRWEQLIPSVFVAEDAIKEVWKPRLEAAKSMAPAAREKVCKDYVHALAVEIVSKTTDEQLANMNE